MRVISGGQTGVDTGALVAAERTGYSWQAILPRGGRREDGPLPSVDFLRGGVYGKPAVMLRSASYGARTRYVVKSADAVLLIAPHLTPGTKLTKELAEAAGKPCHWCKCDDGPYELEAYRWLTRVKPNTLMVAGPRASKWYGGQLIAQGIMALLLEWYRRDPNGELPPVGKPPSKDGSASNHPFVPNHEAGAHPVLADSVEAVSQARPAPLPTARLLRR